MKKNFPPVEWVTLLTMEAVGMPMRRKGAVAFFCIVCVAVNMGRNGEIYSWTRLAQEYAESIGSTQMAVWESIRKMIRSIGWTDTVGEALAWAVLEVSSYGEDRIFV